MLKTGTSRNNHKLDNKKALKLRWYSNSPKVKNERKKKKKNFKVKIYPTSLLYAYKTIAYMINKGFPLEW